MIFEWDDSKNQANIKKHGIDFEDIYSLFEGRTIEKPDTRKNYGELRVTALGQVQGYVIFVVFTIRNGNRRIISARLASKEERSVYYGKD